MNHGIKLLTLGILTMTSLATVAVAQETRAESESVTEERSAIEIGFRTFWGNVYGRPDLPFAPNLSTSKLNEYGDLRKNLYVRRARVYLDNLFGSENYLDYRTQSSVYANQSHLVSIGQTGRFKVQFRYDQIPHIYTNTARTLYTQTQPGVFTFPLSIRQAFQAASSAGTAAQINNSLPNVVASSLNATLQPIVPQIQRRQNMGILSYNLTADWALLFSFARDTEIGTRPIGAILNNNPSASASSEPSSVANRQSPGVGAELPEPIDYVTNNVRALTEFGRGKWLIQAAFDGSYFRSNVRSLRFDSPFATSDIPVQLISPGNGCTVAAPALNCAIASVPAHGEMSLYPNNQSNSLSVAGAFDAGKHLRLMGSTANSWLRQDDSFLPYTANAAITGLAPLPAASLHGDKRALAMNWTAVSKITGNFQLETKYRQYDYNNNTPVLELTPVQGDVMGADPLASGQAEVFVTDTMGRSNPGFNRRTLELSGNYFFAAHSSVKAGWEAEWFDRSHRDVAHSFENSVFGSVDFKPTRDFLLRVAGRHQNRKPNEYQDETAADPITGIAIPCASSSVVFTAEQRCHRRFDEAARNLDSGDVLFEYDLKEFSFTGTFQTTQSNFNRAGGANSPTALNFITGVTRPYYLYGALSDLSWIYTAGATYSVSPALSIFIEFTHENYYKRMISRNRTPTSGTDTIQTCAGCDSANNDWESTTRDLFDTYTGGFDLSIGPRFSFSPYYSLAAGRGNVLSRALGDPTITAGPHKFVLTGTSAPENYPETTTRIHELAMVFKLKLTPNLSPRFEYRFQQFDNRDYQTTPMTPYMGCVGAGAVVVSSPCVNVGSTLAVKSPSLYYPGFVVGDTAAARYLFLGADQPSYKSHIITTTLEYRF